MKDLLIRPHLTHLFRQGSRFGKRLVGVLLATVAVLGLSSCGSAKTPDAAEQTAPQELVVFAAASLNKAFPDIAEEFHKLHPEADIRFSFEGSSTLVDQLGAGAPAHVFASADLVNMERAKDFVDTSQVFTNNVLTLIVPPGNPAKITGLNESLQGHKLVVCEPRVPCGKATVEVFKAAGVPLDPVSQEQKVTDVRGKVESGQADAGLVYVTDATAAGDRVEKISIPEAAQVVNEYAIAVVKGDHQTDSSRELAQAFVDYVMGAQGQQILAKYGFGTGG